MEPQLNELNDELLRTLSFYEAMSLEMIFIDLDDEYTLNNPDITMDRILHSLKILESNKKLSRTTKDGQTFWVKKHPSKKSYWRRFLNYLNI